MSSCVARATPWRASPWAFTAIRSASCPPFHNARFPSTHLRHNATATPTLAGALSGIKILDLTRILAGPFCTQILGDYGADIIKVEHPKGGDDTRLWRETGENTFWKDSETTSLYFNTINRNKKSITVNLKHRKGKLLVLDLARQADIVVENFVPGKLDELGLGYETLKAVNSSIILGSISGYGYTGPYARRAGYDVIGAAEGGLLHVTGEADGVPTKPGVGLMDMCTGLYLHGAILAALRQRDMTGGRNGGIGQHIDTSLLETTVSILANVGMTWINLEKEAQRWGTAHPTIVPYESFPTKDTFFVIGAVNDRQFELLCQLVGKESKPVEGTCGTTDILKLPQSPLYCSNTARIQNRVMLHNLLAAQFRTRTTKDWENVFEGSGLPYGPVNTLQQVFQHPQVIARRMVEEVPQDAAISGSVKVLGMPVKFSETQPKVRYGPPGLGQHTEEVLSSALGLSNSDIAILHQEGAI